MHTAVYAALLTTLAAGPLAARDILLGSPLDCDLRGACFIQQYYDHDPTDAASDYRCATLSYDTHKGTDFALRTLTQMHLGVDVVAAAKGIVRATRDGMPDQIYNTQNSAEIDGRDCGNGVVIDHSDGWTTQYCHLKQGSVAVSRGDYVSFATRLGQVGLSGRTQFPHVHLTVRKDGNPIDPFDPDGKITCDGADTNTLWIGPMPYQPGGMLTVGFSDNVPDYDAVKDGSAARRHLPSTAPALVVFGYAFGGRTDDEMLLIIDGPNGLFIHETVKLNRNRARFFHAIGKKRSSAPWPVGTYRGIVSLIRDEQTISKQSVELTIE